MANGFVVPKVTLYRSLVGMICALWLIEGGLNRQRILGALPQLSMGHAKEWLLSQPTRIVLVAAWAMLAGQNHQIGLTRRGESSRLGMTRNV